ncbi:hypothetical protein J7E95_40640 [Streptomyces sp. ISL-14]|nr:hypothetical protein [Streptomyces sp. ISL-14]
MAARCASPRPRAVSLRSGRRVPGGREGSGAGVELDVMGSSTADGTGNFLRRDHQRASAGTFAGRLVAVDGRRAGRTLDA